VPIPKQRQRRHRPLPEPPRRRMGTPRKGGPGQGAQKHPRRSGELQDLAHGIYPAVLAEAGE